jgi:Glutathione S-transferase, N-terminal domain
MTRTILYVFAISHYCEKARWALDHYGIDYELEYTMPGANRKIAKKLGAKSGSLPKQIAHTVPLALPAMILMQRGRWKNVLMIGSVCM